MKKSYHFLITILFLGAYLLSACGGTLPQQNVPAGSSQSTEAVFTGTVEAKEGTVWLISGQQVNVDGSSSIDPNIQVGDIVRVEAKVSADGAVVALKIEVSSPDDGNANDNTMNDNAGNDISSNTNDVSANANDNSNTPNDNGNMNDNSNSAPSGTEQEVFGVVEANTADSITINGITYSIASFTEFKDLIAVGDQVKIHVLINADGTLTIREIEKSTGASIGNNNDDNSNASFNVNSNDDSSNMNSNDDDHNNSNSNGDDDHEDDDNNNGGSNSNDD